MEELGRYWSPVLRALKLANSPANNLPRRQITKSGLGVEEIRGDLNRRAIAMP